MFVFQGIFREFKGIFRVFFPMPFLGMPFGPFQSTEINGGPRYKVGDKKGFHHSTPKDSRYGCLLLSLVFWISLVNFEQGISLMILVFSLFFPRICGFGSERKSLVNLRFFLGKTENQGMEGQGSFGPCGPKSEKGLERGSQGLSDPVAEKISNGEKVKSIAFWGS